MVIRLTLICLVPSLVTLANADDADIKKVAWAQAEETQNALIKGEFETLVRRTHPKVVEQLGGKEKMMAFLTTELKKMKDQGFGFKSAKISDPGELFRVGKDLYVGIPMTLEMTAPGGRLTTSGFLVGVSKDDGKSWVFVDCTPGRDKVKLFLTDLPDGIVIPKKVQPTFIKD